jgi:hypothetical protein
MFLSPTKKANAVEGQSGGAFRRTPLPARAVEGTVRRRPDTRRSRNRSRRLRPGQRSKDSGRARSGESKRTSCPSLGSYSRTVVIASGAPNGRSLETSMLPFGAITRSSGLRSGSRTRRGDRMPPPGATTRIVSSPSPFGPMPDARNSRPSEPKANPRGNGTIPRGRTCSPPRPACWEAP